MAGDKTSCGAVLLPQQNLVLRMSGTGKSRNADFETESISSSQIETSQLDLINILSRLSTKPLQLSEDNILLTAVEANKLFQSCFKQIAYKNKFAML